MYTVYIVDDDPLILDEIIKSVPWLDNGFSIIGFASSPQTAVKEIINQKPDVVFCDLKMPGMDGIEMIQEIASQKIECQYVMLSAYGTFEDSRRFFRQEGFDYLLKPVNLPEVQLVLERLAQKLSVQKPCPPANDTNTMPPVFTELIQYLENNLQKRHTLEDLGKRFGLNPKYLCSLFSKNMDTTLTRYITDMRMKKALDLMKNSNMAYKEIAIDCGYCDYFYFCRVFKEYYGYSPSIYMRMLEEGQMPKK